MSNGFFGRLARKWWLMLVIGILVGFAAGLPLGGQVMPENLAGTTFQNSYERSVGQTLDITISNAELFDYDSRYIQHMGTQGAKYTLKVIGKDPNAWGGVTYTQITFLRQDNFKLVFYQVKIK